MAKKITKVLKAPAIKLQKKGLRRGGGVMDDEGWSESSDGSWSDFTGSWMDFTQAAKINRASTPARALKRRNIKVKTQKR